MGTYAYISVQAVRIISRKPLKELAERFPDAKNELDAWFHEVTEAEWKTPAELKQMFGNSSILKGSRAVFNICGNKYRVIVKINYPYSVVYVRFAGTHTEYDEIDAETI